MSWSFVQFIQRACEVVDFDQKMQILASDVLKKFPTCGNLEKHQLFVKEMLVSTDEYMSVQPMVTDPFGSYVVLDVWVQKMGTIGAVNFSHS
ncbi:PUF domain-containing protein/NABP domain-containing protein [Artemisia annua]|uniref:PUF domain-containing protein/NABP domain-containing protein n=1 Tax=Artemisia annua TaxID=35608 RepID=A0A2U1L0W9_ARTAN|nr:PUF domain-containing protein/NABP domain-containing protein [Artemisia annua]